MTPEIKTVSVLCVVAIACLVFARAIDKLLTREPMMTKEQVTEAVKSVMESQKKGPRPIEQIESDITNLREHLASKEVIPDRAEKEMAMRDLGTELNLAWTGLIVGKIRAMDAEKKELVEQVNVLTQKYQEAENIIAELVTRVGNLEDKQ